MLQTTDGPRRLPRVLHAGVFGLLVASTMATTSLHRQARSQENGGDEARVANKTGAAIRSFDGILKTDTPVGPRPSIDLSYLPEAKQGLVAVRPKAIFARPDMRPITAIIDAAIAAKLAELGVDEEVTLSVADLEQAVGTVVIEVLDPDGAPGERGRLTMGLSALRSEKHLPVKEVLKATHAGTIVTSEGNATVIETPEAAIPAFGPMRHFAMPDDHTVLPGISGQALTKLAERPASEQISAKPWFGLWHRVEQNMFAMVLDNSNEGWNAPWDDADLPETKTLAAQTKFFALGCDLEGDKLNVQLIVECADAADSDVVIDSLKGVLQHAIRQAEEQSPKTAAASVHSIRARDEDPVGETHDADYFRRIYVSVLQSLENSEPKVDAGRVALQASVDVDISTIAALAADFASEMGTSAPASSK